MRDSIAKGVSIGLNKAADGGANVMMKNKIIFWVSLAAAVSVAATGCGRSRGGADVVVRESETEVQTQAQVPVTVDESETETEAPKLITSVEYTSKDGTVKITLPDNTWKVTQDADEMRVFSSASDAMINIVHASTDSAMKTLSVQTTKEDLEAALTKQYSDTNAYDIQSFEKNTIGNVNTYRYVVKYNAAARMWAYSVTSGIVAPDQAYVITGTVTNDNSTLLKAVEDSVDSFTVLKDEELKNVTGATVAGTTTPETKTGDSTTSTQENASLKAYGAATTLYSNDTVNVRSGPGTDAEVIGGFGPGDAVMVIGETSNWYQVSVNGQTGYVRKDFLTSNSNATQTPAQTSSSAEASGESATAYNYGSAVTMYATDGVNVRSQPSTGSDVNGTLNSGTSVTVVGETDNWYIVSTGSGTGYISKSYLSSTAPATGGTSDGSGSSGGSSSGSGGGSGSGSLSGTVTGSTADTITLLGDDGNTYIVYTGEADITTTSGLYSGLYVNVAYSQNADGSLSASYVSG